MLQSSFRVMLVKSDKVLQDDYSLFADDLEAELKERGIEYLEGITLQQAKLFIQDPSNNPIHVLLIYQHGNSDNSWREILTHAKSFNIYSEIIVVATEYISIKANPDANMAAITLKAGCLAFFQEPFEMNVLLGYIEGAYAIIKARKARAAFSTEINRQTSLETIAEIALSQIRELELNFDAATIVLLSERSYLDYESRDLPAERYIKRLVRTHIKSYNKNYSDIQDGWKLMRPIADDELMFDILTNYENRRVFPDIKDHPKWNKNLSPLVESWIVLPLKYADKHIGLITLDFYEQAHALPLSRQVNTIALETIANQAAIALKNAEAVESLHRLEVALHKVLNNQELKDVLASIARQACELVKGTYSYVVQPNASRTQLDFVAAWSKDHESKFLQVLQREVKRFDINHYENNYRRKGGITTLVYRKNISRLAELINEANAYGLNEEQIKLKLDSFEPYIAILDDCANKAGFRPSSVATLYEWYMRFDYRVNDKFTETGSNLAVPIIIGDQVIGVLNVEHESPYAFTQSYIDLIQQFAKFGALAIRNHTTSERMKRLFKASSFATLASDSKLDKETLDEIAEDISKETGADFVEIFVCNDESTVRKGWNRNFENYPGTAPSRGESGLTRWSIDNRKPVIIGDVERYVSAIKSVNEELANNPGWQLSNCTDIDRCKDLYGSVYSYRNPGTGIENLIAPNQTLNPSTKSIICVPLFFRDRRCGAMWLQYTQTQRFTVDEIEDLKLYGNSAAVLIEHLEERQLHQFSLEVGQKKDKVEVLNSIIDFIVARHTEKGRRDHVPIEPTVGAGVYEYIHETRTLKLAAARLGSDFPANVKELKGEEGIAGKLFHGSSNLNARYLPSYLHIPDYDQDSDSLDEDKGKGLQSVLLIRLQPLQGVDPVGVLVINDKRGRTYKQTLEDFLELAQMAANHLALIRFAEIAERPYQRKAYLFLKRLFYDTPAQIGAWDDKVRKKTENFRRGYILLFIVALVIFVLLGITFDWGRDLLNQLITFLRSIGIIT